MSTLRDTYRIKPFLQTLEELWVQYPDERFFQFVSNLGYRLNLVNPSDPYHVEDDVTQAAMNEMLMKLTKGLD